MDEITQPFVCACCGCTDGQAMKDVIRRLHTVEIISKFVSPGDEETSIILCTVCISRMPFNISPLIEEVNQYVDRNTADDAILSGFITRFIADVWPEDEAPSTLVLCKMLNAVGLRTPRGGKWEYHNLNQRMAKLDIDKDKIVQARAKATFYSRIQRLMQAANDWTAAQYCGTPIGVDDGATSVAEHDRRDDIPSVWTPPVHVGMPDLPGMERATIE